MSLPKVHPLEVKAQPSLENLQRRIAELTEAVAARDVFIAVAAHELRNPMTPMIGQIDLLLSAVAGGRYSPGQIEYRLQRIRHVMNHYIKRSAALLDVSRITSGNLHLEHTSCDLAALLSETAETFAEAARHAGCSVRIEAPVSLLGTWDRLAMEQIIDNLLSNAIKYGATQPVEISVKELKDSVRIRIQDHGPGISMNDRARIFERFERAVGQGERHSGFGVGLWVVGQLVEAMDGKISVEDAPGGGAISNVTLPRHVTEQRP